MSEIGTTAPAPKPPASPRTVAILRAVVIGLGVLLIIAFFVLVGQILYLLFARPAQPPSTRPAITREAVEAAVALPPGTTVKSLSLSGDRLAIHVVGPSGDGVIVIDATTGAVVSRLQLAPRAP